VKIHVDVRTREPHDQRSARKTLAPTDDRSMALAGVKCDEQVGRLAVPFGDDADVMTELGEPLCPTLGRDAVA
jgi:hypothetical protein